MFRVSPLSARLDQDGAYLVRVLSDGTVKGGSKDGSFGVFGSPEVVRDALALTPGDTAWIARRSRTPEVISAACHHRRNTPLMEFCLFSSLSLQGGSTVLGRVRLLLASLAQATGELTLPDEPHFLWVTEFPLFTRADPDKEFLAHGRWSSTHHPFTAPMWEDIDNMYSGRISEVRNLAFARSRPLSARAYVCASGRQAWTSLRLNFYLRDAPAGTRAAL